VPKLDGPLALGEIVVCRIEIIAEYAYETAYYLGIVDIRFTITN